MKRIFPLEHSVVRIASEGRGAWLQPSGCLHSWSQSSFSSPHTIGRLEKRPPATPAAATAAEEEEDWLLGGWSPVPPPLHCSVNDATFKMNESLHWLFIWLPERPLPKSPHTDVGETPSKIFFTQWSRSSSPDNKILHSAGRESLSQFIWCCVHRSSRISYRSWSCY